MKLSDYSYSCTKYGWEVKCKGVIVAGLSVNVNLLDKEHDITWYEYHRDCAKKALREIIKHDLDEQNSV